MSAREFTITKLERHEAGYWHARVTGADGVTVYVHRRYGSWMAEVREAPRSRRTVLREVLKPAAKALQEKTRRRERRGE